MVKRDVRRQAQLSSLSPNAEYLAVVRISEAMPLFDKLMSTLDGKATRAPKKDDAEAEIKFFSDNLSRLIKTLAFREVRVRRETEGSTLQESLTYSW